VKPPTPPTSRLLALTAPSPSSFRAEVSVTGETLFHRLPSRDNPAIEFTGPPFLLPTPRSELSGTGATGGRASASSRERQWPPVHGRPGRRSPRTRGLGPRVFFRKTILGKSYFGHFTLRPLSFSKINPQPIIFQSDPEFEKYLQISLKLQKFISLQPQLQI
jgi:hypothetical protein